MAAEAEYVPDSDDEIMVQDTLGDDDMVDAEEGEEEEEEVEVVVLTPQEWKAKAGDLYKVRRADGSPLAAHTPPPQVVVGHI